jgi:hypothetical protein
MGSAGTVEKGGQWKKALELLLKMQAQGIKNQAGCDHVQRNHKRV